MDPLGQLTFMNVPVILMMSQLSQWLLQQVMSQLLHLDVLHGQLPGSIELWMFSMHQALLGKSSKPTSIPKTLVLETEPDLDRPQGYLRPQLQTYPEPLCQVWKFKTPNCTGISS